MLEKSPKELQQENSNLDSYHAQEVCDRIAVAALYSMVAGLEDILANNPQGKLKFFENL